MQSNLVQKHLVDQQVYLLTDVEMLYVKHIIDTVPMSNWGRSYYNNLLSMGPLFVIALLNGEIGKLGELCIHNIAIRVGFD